MKIKPSELDPKCGIELINQNERLADSLVNKCRKIHGIEGVEFTAEWNEKHMRAAGIKALEDTGEFHYFPFPRIMNTSTYKIICDQGRLLVYDKEGNELIL